MTPSESGASCEGPAGCRIILLLAGMLVYDGMNERRACKWRMLIADIHQDGMIVDDWSGIGFSLLIVCLGDGISG